MRGEVELVGGLQDKLGTLGDGCRALQHKVICHDTRLVRSTLEHASVRLLNWFVESELGGTTVKVPARQSGHVPV